MNQQYNFYNLEASFKKFLLAENKIIKTISINNYLSDLRHFLGWLIFRLKNYNIELDLENLSNFNLLAENITQSNLEQYKGYLVQNKIPHKTINRRLSTLRKFCTFCISQGWMKENPAKKIRNASDTNFSLLNEFKKALEQSELEKNEINETVENIQEFLNFNKSFRL